MPLALLHPIAQATQVKRDSGGISITYLASN